MYWIFIKVLHHFCNIAEADTIDIIRRRISVSEASRGYLKEIIKRRVTARLAATVSLIKLIYDYCGDEELLIDFYSGYALSWIRVNNFKEDLRKIPCEYDTKLICTIYEWTVMKFGNTRIRILPSRSLLLISSLGTGPGPFVTGQRITARHRSGTNRVRRIV